MENIEKFKKLHYYGPEGEMAKEELEDIGLTSDAYLSLNECAYQCAYDLSNDWLNTPDWQDVQEAYKMGVKDAINYIKENFGSFPYIDNLFKEE